MSVDIDPFPTTTINMVDARIPRDKGKGKVEVATPQRSLNQNSRPRFNADFHSNKPPTALTGPAIVEPMTGYSTDEDSGSAVLCSKCQHRAKGKVISAYNGTTYSRNTAKCAQRMPTLRGF
ncbi:hypothetical protein ACFX2F_015281 [Malus domestica]